MLAELWAKGLLPVTVNIRKSSSTWKQAILKLEQGDEPWGHRWAHQHADTRNRHKRQSTDGESSKEGIKNPDMTPYGNLSHLQKLTDRLSDFHTAQNG